MVTLNLLFVSGMLPAHVFVRAFHCDRVLSLHLSQVMLLADVACDRDEKALELIIPGQSLRSFQLHTEFDSPRFDLVERQSAMSWDTPQSLSLTIECSESDILSPQVLAVDHQRYASALLA